MRVTDYMILHAESNKGLTDKVKESIARGWEPQGGVLVGGGIKYQSGPPGLPGMMPVPKLDFFQAMVKREA
jgi:hypothetical protein